MQKRRLADIYHLCSNIDVLVIGMGPTGLGAAKRLNHIVCAHRHLHLHLEAENYRLTMLTERPFMADCRFL